MAYTYIEGGVVRFIKPITLGAIMIQWSKNNIIFLKNKSLSMSMIVFSLLCMSISAAELNELMVHRGGFSAPEKSGVLKVLKDKEDYFVLTNSGIKKIHKHDVSPLLRKMNNDQLAHFLNGDNGIIKVDQFTNGEFKLNAHVYGKGGGALGAFAGIVIGKAGVSFLGHGTILALSFLAGPAQPAALIAMESVALPYIEAASVHAAAVCGVAGAALTGPV